MRITLTAVCAYTPSRGWPRHTSALASTLFRYLDTGGHYADAVIIDTHALHAARYTGDRAAEAHTLSNLGPAYIWQSRYQQAADHLQNALALSRETGDRTSEANALDNLGLVYRRQCYFTQALNHHQQALAQCH